MTSSLVWILHMLTKPPLIYYPKTKSLPTQVQYNTQLQYTSTIHRYNTHVKYTSTIHKYNTQVQCTSTTHKYNTQVQYTSTIHKYSAGDGLQVVCGQDHTLFLTSDGQVFSCGLSADGQTGGNTIVVQNSCVRSVFSYHKH